MLRYEVHAPQKSLVRRMLENCRDRVLLYVEDDGEAVALFETAMRQCRPVFNLQIADGLEDAFHFLDRKQVKPMAVLLDFSLGKFKGSDLLRWMRARPQLSDLEVAVFSGLDSERQIKECYGAGADYYLVKPNSFSILLDIVDRVDRGFRQPAKNLFLYPLVMSPAYREPVTNSMIQRAWRKRHEQS
jgi:DNA-binding response OmpR family regulator